MSTTALRAPESTASPDREAFIRKAVELANSNALRLALYQATGDSELAAMRLVLVPVRSGAQLQNSVADEELPKLRDKAVKFLLGEQGPELKPPSEAQVRAMLKIFNSQPVSENYIRFGIEELALDEFPRDVHWRNKPAPEVLKKIKILVIGGGISGVAASIQLTRLGITHRVIERQADIGGTWQRNTYPEARVDTSSYMYQFKFEKRYPWGEFFASRAETKKYLKHVAEKHEVLPNFTFDTEVVAAKWHEGSGSWTVTLRRTDGTESEDTANFLISGSGLFATPSVPDIEGAQDFQGRMFHTSSWDHGFDFKGKRVALIGTGSSGTQLMPALARDTAQLTVYQRTPNWITGVEGYRAKVPEETQWLFKNMPNYWNWYCYSSYDTSLQLQNTQVYDHEWRKTQPGVSESNERLRAALTQYIRSKLGDREDLIKKCIPTYAPMGRRLVVDNGFYESLLRPNVELVTDGIARITPHGIVSSDGSERRSDLIVLAAGYKVSKYLHPVQYEGRDGITLDRAWAKDGARSYLGIAMAGFPNLFMMYGPNGQPRSGGFYSWAEIWARYIAVVIVRTIERGARSVEIKRDVFDEYNDRLDVATKEILWETEGAGGYFNNEFGRSAINLPFRTEDYHAMVVEPNMDDYDIG